MEEREVQQSTSISQIAKLEEITTKRKENLTTVPNPIKLTQQVEIWNRIRYGHVATAMRIRSLLLFISSTLISFIDTISEPKTVKISPAEIIARIVASFIKGSAEKQSLGHETFLDILLEKIPNSDVKGMHYHEVYLAISPMISSVNWARIKFDRRDAMICYNSLSQVLHVCFDQMGISTRDEPDQLFLAVYVSSVWCSILKQHSELTHPISDHQDFESYIKTWIFDANFENFSKVFVASCCQILESSDQIKNRFLKIDNDSEGMEIPQPLSLTASVPEVSSHTDVSTPVLPPLSVHPSWRTAHYDPYMLPYMVPVPHHYASYPSSMMHPPIDPHQTYVTSPLEHISPAPALQPTTPKSTKRKQKLPTFQELADTVMAKTRKKGPKPGTKYRQRITSEASMILEIEATRVAANPPDRHVKRKISERTNISLYQVKSFFNRITAEQRRIRMGTPQRKKHKCPKLNRFMFP